MARHRPFAVAFPTRDLAASERFASALGFTKRNPSVGGTEVVVLTYSDTVSIMYHARVDFDNWLPTGTTTHLPNDPNDANGPSSAQSYVGLTFTSKADVDAMAPAAEQERLGVYYSSVADPDGHLFSLEWLDPRAIEPLRAVGV